MCRCRSIAALVLASLAWLPHAAVAQPGHLDPALAPTVRSRRASPLATPRRPWLCKRMGRLSRPAGQRARAIQARVTLLSSDTTATEHWTARLARRGRSRLTLPASTMLPHPSSFNRTGKSSLPDMPRLSASEMEWRQGGTWRWHGITVLGVWIHRSGLAERSRSIGTLQILFGSPPSCVDVGATVIGSAGVAIQPDGKILVGASVFDFNYGGFLGLARFGTRGHSIRASRPLTAWNMHQPGRRPRQLL